MRNKIKLNNGYEIPLLGLGTWKSISNSVTQAIEFAISEANYRHIDCASIYGNQVEIGQAFNKLINIDNKVKRSDLFITSKLWNTNHHPDNVLPACKKTLSDLQLDYLDLYLIHWGLSFKTEDASEFEAVSIRQTWQAMEELVKQGLVKSIGVSNFTAMMIFDLLTYAKTRPANNQIELHPCNSQIELVKYCQNQGITVTAYSPLGGQPSPDSPHLFEEKIIKDLAVKYKKSPAQIILKWNINRDAIVIPKSTHSSRILENSQLFDFKLSKEEIDQINSLNKNYRTTNPSSWGIPYFK